jgi:hypothetical protein
MRRFVVALAAAELVAGCGSSSSPTPSAPPIVGVTEVNGLPHSHFLGVHLTYSHTPPLGGDHSPYPLTCAVYAAAVPNENAVHSLEHGGVWLTYQPGIDPAPLDALTAIDPSYVLVSPYPGQPAKVIATAWGRQLKVDSATDPRLRAFVERYHAGGQGGEKGAACAGVNPAQAQQLFAQGPPRGQPNPPDPADQTSGSWNTFHPASIRSTNDSGRSRRRAPHGGCRSRSRRGARRPRAGSRARRTPAQQGPR